MHMFVCCLMYFFLLFPSSIFFYLGSDNMYACIDEVTDRIQRKLRRFKERKVKETRGRSGVAALSDKVGVSSRRGFLFGSVWFWLG